MDASLVTIFFVCVCTSKTVSFGVVRKQKMKLFRLVFVFHSKNEFNFIVSFNLIIFFGWLFPIRLLLVLRSKLTEMISLFLFHPF